MASSLEVKLSCPVCLEIYQDPQLLSCGHSFCRRCVGYHPTALYTRTCPVCLQAIHLEPVTNLVLRSACESYQEEKEREEKEREEKEREEKEREEREKDGGIKCLLHGEKILFFCRNDKEALCSQCRKERHSSHRVQPLPHAVHQQKDQIKAALRPAENVLECLRNGTAPERKITKYIESQANQAEKQIKEEFEKLYQFLREEEEVRRAALRKEEEEKKGRLEGWIEQELESLSDNLMEVEEEMANDDVTFLSNYEHIMTRARFRPSDSELNSGSVIDVAKHVGNLSFSVWEKMKDLCPYYPVILNPNSSHIFVSSDLVCASDSVHRFYFSNPLLKNRNCLVLGSEAQNASFNCWDVDVGDSEHWTLGVCRRSAAERNCTQPLTNQNGFWGLRRNGDFYNVLGSTEAQFPLKRPLKTVRVKLTQQLDFKNWKLSWMLRFLDTGSDSVIACTGVFPLGRDFVPFLMPEVRNARLRIVPVKVNVTMEKKFNFLERHMDMINVFVIGFFVVFSMVLAMIAARKIN